MQLAYIKLLSWDDGVAQGVDLKIRWPEVQTLSGAQDYLWGFPSPKLCWLAITMLNAPRRCV